MKFSTSLVVAFCLMTATSASAEINLDSLEGMSFVSDDGQHAVSFNCGHIAPEKSVQRCTLLSTIYTEDEISMESPEDARAFYQRMSPSEARKSAEKSCASSSRYKKVLAASSLLQGRRRDLQRKTAQADKECTCTRHAQPNVCLSLSVETYEKKRTICQVSALTTQISMTKQKDGSWYGQVEKADDNICGSTPTVRIKRDKDAQTVMDYKTRNASDLYVCKVLQRSATLRMFDEASLSLACSEIKHMPIR